jgi:hypothetical protein
MLKEHLLCLSEIYNPWGGPTSPVAVVQIVLIESALPLIRKRATISGENSRRLKTLIATLGSGCTSTAEAKFNRDVVVNYCNRKR